QGLADLGYVEGETFTIDARYADGRRLDEEAAAQAAEMAALAPDVILASDIFTGVAIKAQTSTIPIVLVAPVAPAGPTSGAPQSIVQLIDSLARPGSNLTGLKGQVEGLWSKRLELL